MKSNIYWLQLVLTPCVFVLLAQERDFVVLMLLLKTGSVCVCVSRDYVFCTLEAAGKNIEGWNVRHSTSAGSIKTN